MLLGLFKFVVLITYYRDGDSVANHVNSNVLVRLASLAWYTSSKRFRTPCTSCYTLFEFLLFYPSHRPQPSDGTIPDANCAEVAVYCPNNLLTKLAGIALNQYRRNNPKK
jgi:hypothetical protein